MTRAIVGVIAGYATWTALWLGGNQLIFSRATEVIGAGERYAEPGPLAGVVLLSVVCSVAAGLLTAVLAKDRARGAVWCMAVLLLLTGIGVQASVWSLMPLWYHTSFLVLLLPVAVLAGRRQPLAVEAR